MSDWIIQEIDERYHLRVHGRDWGNFEYLEMAEFIRDYVLNSIEFTISFDKMISDEEWEILRRGLNDRLKDIVLK